MNRGGEPKAGIDKIVSKSISDDRDAEPKLNPSNR